MAQFRGLSGTAWRPTLSPPGLTPRDMQDAEMLSPQSAMQIGPDGTTTNQVVLAPASEHRLMLADRSRVGFQPGPNYANQDPQKGGAPGSPGADPSRPNPSESFITSQREDGTTVAGGLPPSPLKLSYGAGDWQEAVPTFLPAHLAINKFANPNRPQVNPTPFNNEGPQQNTQYTAPAPWAVGVFIG